MKKNKYYPFSIHELKVILKKKFRPRVLQEYFKEDGVDCINVFKPTKYMVLKGKPLKLPKSILDLLFHLVNYDTKKYEYLINWLASFFKYLIKSQVAIALIGNQGAGKGILFYIISELFGTDYCTTINDESLNSRFKAKIFENKIFYNFDEITFNTARKNDSVLKAIITNKSVSLEEKNVTMERETELHGQCLFTSNHAIALNVEESDRRYTVFNTGNNLSKTNFLNFGTFEILEASINGDLEDFAKYLKNYDVDIALANTALDTPEKMIIINASKNIMKDLHRAVLDMNIFYFDELQETNLPLYINIYSNFKKGKIDRADITKAYNELFSGKNITAKELMARFREFKPYDQFTEQNMSHSGNSHFFHLIGR